MILWRKVAHPESDAFMNTSQGFFPLGQIAPPNPNPTDNQEKRMTWMWDPGPGWLPGAIPVASPDNPVPLIPRGNRIGEVVPPVRWMP